MHISSYVQRIPQDFGPQFPKDWILVVVDEVVGSGVVVGMGVVTQSTPAFVILTFPFLICISRRNLQPSSLDNSCPLIFKVFLFFGLQVTLLLFRSTASGV